MENSYEELFKFLNDSGKLGSLRKYLISILLNMEELRTDVETPETHRYEETDSLVRDIEFQLNQLSKCQQIADKLFIDMGKEGRQALYREAPELFRLFGWHDKINEAGDIIEKR